MKKGFDDSGIEVEFDVKTDDVERLLKKYKKVKKYQRSAIHEAKVLSGQEDIVTELIREAKEAGY